MGQTIKQFFLSALVAVCAAVPAFASWVLDKTTPEQGYLTDGIWKLAVATSKSGTKYIYTKTVTNEKTKKTYEGYEVTSNTNNLGSGKLDLSSCRVDLGHGVVSIGYGAFKNSSTITSLVGPDVVKICGEAFRWSPSIATCDVSPEIFYIGGLAFSWSDKTPASVLERFTPTYMPELYFIGDTGNTGRSAFENCTLLTGDFYLGRVTDVVLQVFKGSAITSIELPECTKIRDNAFNGCTSLTNAVMPKVATFGVSAFSSCASLKSVTMDGSIITSIDSTAFSGIPNAEGWPTDYPNLVSLGTDAFRNGSLAGDVSMPLITFSERIFNNCPKLTSLYAPKLATYGYWDFKDCKALTNVTLNGSASFFTLSPVNKRAPSETFSGTALEHLTWTGLTMPTNKPTGSALLSRGGNGNASYRPVVLEVPSDGDVAAWADWCTTKKADLTEGHKLIANYAELPKNRIIGFKGTTPPVKDGKISGQYYTSDGELCWVIRSSSDLGLTVIVR